MQITKKSYFVKAVSVCLAVVMLFAFNLLPTYATTSGNWTDNGNYDSNWTTSGNLTISDAADLASFAKAVNDGTDFEGQTINLNANINLEGHYWIPIGNASLTTDSTTKSPIVGTNPKGFAGTFNGNGNTISNMEINISSTVTTGVGLFGYITPDATVKDFTLEGSVTVSTGIDAVAAVVGYNSGTVEEVVNKASVTADSAYNVGGIAGFNNGYYGTDDPDGIISKCGNEGAIRGKSKTGGIAGENSGGINTCYNYATIYNASAAKAGTGGIVGRNGNNNTAHEVGTITNCYNRGYVNNNNGYWGGGIAGFQSSGCSITNCYDTGDVYSCSYSNPICGKQEGTATYCYSKSGLHASGSSAAEVGTTKDLSDMKASSFEDLLNTNAGSTLWDFSNLLNSSLPYLVWQGTTFSDSNATDGTGGGTSDTPNWGSNTGTIVLDGRFASDGVAGTNKTGYKTLNAAITAANAASVSTIYVTGPVTITGTSSSSINEQTLGTGITLCRDSSYKDGYLFSIGAYGKLTMTGGTISGNSLAANAQIEVLNNGTFEMSGGSITGGTAKYLPGAGVRVCGGTFTMSGGSLTALNGGTGAYTCGAAVTVSSGTFTMNGTSTISGNTVHSAKGIVYVAKGATFNLGCSGIASGQVVYLANTSGLSDAYITLNAALSSNLSFICEYLADEVIVAIANSSAIAQSSVSRLNCVDDDYSVDVNENIIFIED